MGTLAPNMTTSCVQTVTRNSDEALNSSFNDYWQVIPTYVYLAMKFREDPYRIHNGIGIVDCLASGEGLGIWLLP